ncbi:MAG: PTS sugar transporter subunit IIA [Synergistaceae bacterium]|jgi:PTS system galactitol-specific IIA component|nr:PTS sugar transporter subunit IIA [Synergistaceae bacterium]
MMDQIDFQIDFNEELTLFHPDARDADEVLDAAAHKLLELGCVLPSFGEALKERERSYPTGIPFEANNVAIPHADSEYVRRSAMAACVLGTEVSFGNMADRQELIPVRLVFVLALADSKSHLSLLQVLMKSLQNPELTGALSSAPNRETACKLVKDGIFSSF